MGKQRKIDIRLTQELDDWIQQEAERHSLSKSSFARMRLEQLRRESERSSDHHPMRVAESPAKYGPKKTDQAG